MVMSKVRQVRDSLQNQQMAEGHDPQRPPIVSDSSSFVYPTRSLLSGIRPAPSRHLRFHSQPEASPMERVADSSSDHMPHAFTETSPQTQEAPLDKWRPHPHMGGSSVGTSCIAGPSGEAIPLRSSNLSPDSPSPSFHSSALPPTHFSEVVAAAFSDKTCLVPPLNVGMSSSEAENPVDATRRERTSMGYVHLPSVTRSTDEVVNAWVQSTVVDTEKLEDRIINTSLDTLTEVHHQPERYTTSRYTHIENEDGHHILTGHDVAMTRCEDEPIRSPGAVQGFGVLVVVEEDEEAGLLVVRQVSENAPTILGLSPAYLFSLKCFTDTLPEAEADILWDNIQFLDEPQNSTGDQEHNPHIFLLTGWGEPVNATFDKSRALNDRRLWTCWCALHRPSWSDSSSSEKGLIILEFELERDAINPLYAIISPPSTELVSPGSPLESDSSVSSSDTLFSTGDVGESERKAILHDQSLSTFAPEDDEDQWKPAIEVIVESTTNYAKPIPALERMRRTSSDAGSPRRTRRRRNSMKQGSADSVGVGVMDLFSVVNQINEQLGATADLETLLKVTVGIIKDLTQFHRVMVYQFDEEWNGEVVSELVNWDQSRDLYKGLHFPASDIPAQARQLYAINTVRLLYDRTQTTARLIVRDKSDLEVPLNMTYSYLRAMSPIHLQYLENMGVKASLSVSIMASGSLWGLIACHSYGQHGMRVSFPVRQMLRLISQTISRNIERFIYTRHLQTRKLTYSIPQAPSGTHIVSNEDDLLELFGADYAVLVIGEGAKIIGPNSHGQEILIVAEYLRMKRFDAIQVSQAVIHDFPDLRISTGLSVIAGLLYIPLSSGGKDFIVLLRKGQLRNVRWAGRASKDQGGSLEPRRSFRTWSESVAGRSRAWTDEEVETASILSLVYGKFIEVWRQKESAITTNLTNILLSNASHEVRTPLNHIINCLEMAMDGPLDVTTRENLSRSYTASKNLLFTINDLLDLTRLEQNNQVPVTEPFDLRSAIGECVRIYQNEAKRRGIEFILDLEGGPQGAIGDVKKIMTVVANLTANALKHTTKGSVTVQSRLQDDPGNPHLHNTSQTAVEIIVSDTGCGVSSDKLESIFREFEQVESQDKSRSLVPGVGLGLAVAVRIVAQLGGQLRVTSTVGTGSQFSFIIPLRLSYTPLGSGAETYRVATRKHSRAQDFPRELAEKVSVPTKDGLGISPERPTSTLTTTNPLNGLRILIVEDNDVNRKVLMKRLQMDGHTVLWSANGQEGVDKVQSDRNFDCILMDIMMPILNGFESTKCIREIECKEPLPSQNDHASAEVNARIPIFAVSASLLERERTELVRHGFDGWILKPIDFARLRVLLAGITDPSQREANVYTPGCNWELGGWF